MAGSCWRLLAPFLILMLPALLRGQDGAPSHTPIRALSGDQILAPDPPRLPHLPIAPIRIPQLPIVLRQPGHYPPNPDSGGLNRLVHASGIIFSGSVTSVGSPASASGQNQSSTTVTFKVEHALRGAFAGRNLTIHEWAALWASGERYRVGEHVLLFLYAPSKLGLTSPVDGGMGRFAIDSHGQIVMNSEHIATLATDPILGGKILVRYSDIALAVRRSSGEE